MIRWLLFAAFVFLVIAVLQSFLASRREKKLGEGKDLLPTLPPLPNAKEVENSRRELEELERQLNIPPTGPKGKEA